MQGFEPVTLTWKGEDFTVPAKDQLELIMRIEDALIGEGRMNGEQAITILFRKGGPPHARLARAFSAALRFAGCKVTDEEVYLSIQDDISRASAAEVTAKTTGMLMGVLAVISPPTFRELTGGAKPSAEGAALPKA